MVLMVSEVILVVLGVVLVLLGVFLRQCSEHKVMLKLQSANNVVNLRSTDLRILF